MAKAGLEAALLDAQPACRGRAAHDVARVARSGEPARVLSTAVVGLAGSIDELLAVVATGSRPATAR